MRARTLAFSIIFLLSASILFHAQQSSFLIPVEMNGQFLRGSIGVAQHENEGMIGINGKGTEVGYRVEIVTPGFPAAIAGILAGDIIVSMDGRSIKGLDTLEALKLIANKREGETVSLAVNRKGEAKTFAVIVSARKHLLANDIASVLRCDTRASPAERQVE